VAANPQEISVVARPSRTSRSHQDSAEKARQGRTSSPSSPLLTSGSPIRLCDPGGISRQGPSRRRRISVPFKHSEDTVYGLATSFAKPRDPVKKHGGGTGAGPRPSSILIQTPLGWGRQFPFQPHPEGLPRTVPARFSGRHLYQRTALRRSNNRQQLLY